MEAWNQTREWKPLSWEMVRVTEKNIAKWGNSVDRRGLFVPVVAEGICFILRGPRGGRVIRVTA